MEPFLSVRNLNYTYRAGSPWAHPALAKINLSVDRGERVAVVGPSSAGKSTLLLALARLLTLSAGQVFVDGVDITDRHFDVEGWRSRIGVVFQDADAQIVEDIVGADVAFGPTMAGEPPASTRAAVERSLNAVGLPYADFRLRYVHSLSGGQRRRVALAGVLAIQPELLLLDEPTSGLDPAGRDRMLAVLTDVLVDRAVTLVVASASLAGAALLCDRVVLLDGGDRVFDIPLTEALERRAVLAAHQVGVPELVVLRDALSAIFPDVPSWPYTLDDLVAVAARNLGMP